VCDRLFISIVALSNVTIILNIILQQNTRSYYMHIPRRTLREANVIINNCPWARLRNNR